MPNEFMVVGEHRTDDQWLLVQGSDGRYYGYHPRRKRLKRVDPDEQWVRHPTAEPEKETRPRSGNETKHRSRGGT